MRIQRLALFTTILLALVAATVLAAPLPILDDANTVALLHLNGNDASTTITDESGKTWTAAGNAQIDTAQSVFGGASGLLDGNGDYVYSSDSVDWRLDGGSNSNAWTIDFRVRFNGDPGTAHEGFVTQYQSNGEQWTLAIASNLLFFQVKTAGTTPVDFSKAWNPAGDTWYHVAAVKDGTNGYMLFVDGVQLGENVVDTDPLPDLSGELRVGMRVTVAGAPQYVNGWIDELRISNGVARWTDDFSPPDMQFGDLQLTQTAAALTQTHNANQTATAAALTQTYYDNQTATAVALTQTYYDNQTATAAALTQTYYDNQTATAAALTLTAGGPTLTNTPAGGIGTPVFIGEVSYGDIARFNALACIVVVLTLFLLAWIVVSFMKREPRR